MKKIIGIGLAFCLLLPFLFYFLDDSFKFHIHYASFELKKPQCIHDWGQEKLSNNLRGQLVIVELGDELERLDALSQLVTKKLEKEDIKELNNESAIERLLNCYFFQEAYSARRVMISGVVGNLILKSEKSLNVFISYALNILNNKTDERVRLEQIILIDFYYRSSDNKRLNKAFKKFIPALLKIKDEDSESISLVAKIVSDNMTGTK